MVKLIVDTGADVTVINRVNKQLLKNIQKRPSINSPFFPSVSFYLYYGHFETISGIFEINKYNFVLSFIDTLENNSDTTFQRKCIDYVIVLTDCFQTKPAKNDADHIKVKIMTLY
jgi:hypothetical protein